MEGLKDLTKTKSIIPPNGITDIAGRKIQKERNYSTLNLPSNVNDQLAIPIPQSRESSPRATEEAVSTIALIICYELFTRQMVSNPERDQFKSK